MNGYKLYKNCILTDTEYANINKNRSIGIISGINEDGGINNINIIKGETGFTLNEELCLVHGSGNMRQLLKL